MAQTFSLEEAQQPQTFSLEEALQPQTFSLEDALQPVSPAQQPTTTTADDALMEARRARDALSQSDPGFFENIATGLGSGFVGIYETAALGAATLLNEGNEDEARRVIQEAADAITPEGGDKEAITYKLAQGVGSILGFFPAALLGKFALPAAGALAVGAASGEASERAREAGATVEERTTAAGLAAPIGLLEITPLGRMLKALKMPVVGDAIDNLSETIVGGITDRIGAGTMREIGDRIANATTTGGLEGAQEAAAEIAQNLIQQQVYDPEQELLGGVGEALGIGGGAGAIVQALVDTFSGRRARTPTGEIQDADTQPEPGATVDGVPPPVGGLGDTAATDDLADAGAGAVDVPAGAVDDVGAGTQGIGDTLIPETQRQLDESTRILDETQAAYDNEIARQMDQGLTEEEARIQINSTQPQLQGAVEEAKTRKTRLEEKANIAKEEAAKAQLDVESVTPAPLPAEPAPLPTETTPASEQTVAQRLDSLNVPKGAAIRKRLKDVDISTREGFVQLDEELRKYVANPRANEAAKTRINEYLAAGDEATGPLVATEEQLAPEPTAETAEPVPEIDPTLSPAEVQQELEQEPASEPTPEARIPREDTELGRIEGVLSYARQKQKAAEAAYQQAQARARQQVIDEAAQAETEISPQDLPRLVNDLVSQTPEAVELSQATQDVNALASGAQAITTGRFADLGEDLRRTTTAIVKRLNVERKAAEEAKAGVTVHVVPDSLPERDTALVRVSRAKGFPRGPKLEPTNAFQIYASKTQRPEELVDFIAYDIVNGSNELKKTKGKAPSPAFVDEAEPTISLQEIRAYLGIPKGKISQAEQDRARRELGESEDYFVKRNMEHGLYHRLVALRAAKYLFDNASPEARALLLERIAVHKREQLQLKANYTTLGMDPDIDRVEMERKARLDQVEITKASNKKAAAEAKKATARDITEFETEADEFGVERLENEDAVIPQLFEEADSLGIEESLFNDNIDYEIDLTMTRLGIPADLNLNSLLASENPVHPVVYQAVKEGDLYLALKRMANTVGNKRLSQVLNTFAANVGGTKVQLVPGLTNARGEAVAGQFDPETNTISLNADVTLTPHALGHEMAHAITLNEIRNNPNSETVRKLRTIFNDLKGRLDTAYGAQSLEEFVAEIMTNEQFRAQVARMSVKGRQISALRDFIHTVRNFLRRLAGMQPKPITTQLAEIDNLIDSIIDPAPYSSSGAPVYLNSNRDGVNSIFKRMGTNLQYNKAIKDQAGRTSMVGEILRFITRTVPDAAKNLLFGAGDLLTVSQIAEELGLGRVGYEVQRTVETQRDRLIKRDRKAQQKLMGMKNWFGKAGAEAKTLFEDVIYSNEFGATIYQVDPSKPQSAYKGKTIDTPEGNIDLEQVWLEQRDAWNRLGNITVDGVNGQQLFTDLRDFYAKQRKDLLEVIKGSLKDVMPGDASASMRQSLIDRLVAEQDTLEVYFPLERQGDFMLIYNLTPEAALRNPALPGYVVRFFNTPLQRDAAIADARNDADVDQNTLFTEDAGSVARIIERAPSNSFVNELLRSLNQNAATNGSTPQAEALREEVLRTFVAALPQTALARSLQKRKRVPGYEKDSVLAFENRAFDFGRRIERFQAIKELNAAQNKLNNASKNLMQGPQVQALFDQNPNVPLQVLARNTNQTVPYLRAVKAILDNTQDPDAANRLVNRLQNNIRLTAAELNKRIDFAREGAANKDFEQVVKTLNQTAFLFTIGFNVSSYLVNLSQIPLFAYPYLSADYGYGATYAAIREAQKLVGFFKNDIERYYEIDDAGNFVPTAEVTDPERRNLLIEIAPLVKEASTRGLLNQTYVADIIGLGEQKNLLDTITGFSAGMFQHGERYNRQVTLLAIYQLESARQKAENQKRAEGERFVDPVVTNRAINNTIEKTQMVNSGTVLETGMRYSQQSVGRLAFMYKGYGFRMYTTMLQSFRDLVRNAFPGTDAEARRKRNVALGQLIGLHGSAILFAGAYGIPLYGAVAMAYDLFAEDDEDDFDTIVRKYLGELGFKGPINEITGLDVANRVRLSGLIIQENRYNSGASMEENAAFYLGGPALSTANRIRRGIEDLSNGDLERGVENILPASISNAYKSAFGRYREDGGVFTRRGDPIYSDMSTGELAAQFFGFPPNEYTFIQERNLRDKRVEKAVTGKRTELLKKYYVATRTGDADRAMDTLEEIMEFNMRHPYAGINADAIRRSMKQHVETSKNMHDGVTISPLMRQAIKMSNLEYDL